MKSWRNLALALAAGLALVLPARALDWKAKALTVATTPFQTTVDAVYEFKNSGTRPVTIRDVQTNCDCLEADADQKVYAPGMTGTIRTRFTVGDRTGLYERTIAVMTDEPDSSIRLTLQIEVPVAATLVPRSIIWQLNEPVTEKSVDVQVAPGLEIIFTETIVTSEAFVARLETVEPGRHYRLHLQPHGTTQPASAAIRIFGHEKSGHDVVVSAYASIP